VEFGRWRVAAERSERLARDRLPFVPAAEPPHKPASGLAPAHHRFRMTALAVRERPGFEVSDLELQRAGPSYTVQTLQALQSRGDLHLLIGSETFLDLLNWKEPWQVTRLARLVVGARNSTGFAPDAPAAQKGHRELRLPDFI